MKSRCCCFCTMLILLMRSFASAQDTIAPAVPENLTITYSGTTSVNLSWTASVDNVGVTGYQVLRNGVPAWTGTARVATIGSLAQGTLYTFAVRARDAANNWSAPTAAKAVRTWVQIYSGSGHLYRQDNYDQNGNYIDTAISEDWQGAFETPGPGALKIYTTGTTDTRGWIFFGATGSGDSGIANGNFVIATTTPGGWVRFVVTGQDEWCEGPYQAYANFKPENQSPAALFSATPSAGASPLTVSFDANATADPDGAIASYEWDFDHDGATDATGPTASHVFSNPESSTVAYTVTLKVTDQEGAATTTTRTLSVNRAEFSPVITSASHALGALGVAFSHAITATNSPTSYHLLGSLPAGLALNATSGVISGTPTQAGTFDLTVHAVNGIGSTMRPLTVVIRPAQTITFPAIGDHVYGDPSFTLEAASSAGLPVSYTVTSGPATVFGPTVTLTGTGMVTIRASQAGDSTFGPAAAADRSFFVARAPQTITFPAIPDRQLPDPPLALSSHASSGLPVTYAVSSGFASIAGTIATLTDPGPVTITATQSGNATYEAAPPVSRTFNVSAGAGYYFVSVINGVASRPGGVSSATLTLSATPQPGKYFSGWRLISGSGKFFDLAQTSTTFTIGSGNATLIADYIASPPVHSVSWTAVNLPLVAASNSLNGFGAIVRNSGTAPWSRNVAIHGASSTYPFVNYAVIDWFSPGGLAPGASAPLMFILRAPVEPGTKTYTYSAAPTPFSNDHFGSQAVRFIQVTPYVQSPPLPGWASVWIERLATVGTAITINASASNSPTSYTLAGSLPPGLILDATTGIVSGTPTQPGGYSVTISARNAAGTTSAVLWITVHPDISYALAIQGGSAPVSALTPGSTTTITANLPPEGSIFNGWSVVAGSCTVADWRSPSTTLTMTATPGTVRANFIPGRTLTVIDGTSNPLGGAGNAAVSIAAKSDADGQMFSYWSKSGEGSLHNPASQHTTFTMGGTPATVRAHFIPGYRLTLLGGASASATGGRPGDSIDITASAMPAGTVFSGWNLSGPGYILNTSSPASTMIMAAGAAAVEAYYQPVSWGEPLMSYLVAQKLLIRRNEPVPLLAYTVDRHGLLTEQRVDHSIDGGLTWVTGTLAENRRWTGTPPAPPQDSGVWVFAPSFRFSTAGEVIFRVIGLEQGFTSSVYAYARVMISNEVYVPPPAITSAATAAGTLGFAFTYNVAATNSPVSYGVDGTLPPGLALHATAGTISGTPSSVGTWTVTLRALNSGGAGTRTLAITINPNSAPVITQQPADTFTPAGTTTTLSVTASGAGILAYQWKKSGNILVNGGRISGATSGTLTLSNTQAADIGTYSVTITSAGGITTSELATLQLVAAPAIIAQPASRMVAVGESFALSVTASGAPAPTYQWRKNGVAIPGAIHASLPFNSVQAGDAGAYTVIAGNLAGSVISQPAYITVGAPRTTIDLIVHRP